MFHNFPNMPQKPTTTNELTIIILHHVDIGSRVGMCHTGCFSNSSSIS